MSRRLRVRVLLENMFVYSFPEILYGLCQKYFLWIDFSDGSPDQATAYHKEKMKKEMSKRMSGNVNSVTHKNIQIHNTNIYIYIYLYMI